MTAALKNGLRAGRNAARSPQPLGPRLRSKAQPAANKIHPETGTVATRPKLNVGFDEDANQVFSVQRLTFNELRGNTRDLSGVDADFCTIALARTYRLAEFQERFSVRKLFLAWHAKKVMKPYS